MSIDHPRIWLQSAEDAKDRSEGRMWCEDKVWPESVEDHEPTEYVRADLYASTQAEILRLKAALERIRDYPPSTHSRRDEDGYPSEIVYDEFAYRRIVDSYRSIAARSLSQDGEGK